MRSEEEEEEMNKNQNKCFSCGMHVWFWCIFLFSFLPSPFFSIFWKSSFLKRREEKWKCGTAWDTQVSQVMVCMVVVCLNRVISRGTLHRKILLRNTKEGRENREWVTDSFWYELYSDSVAHFHSPWWSNVCDNNTLCRWDSITVGLKFFPAPFSPPRESQFMQANYVCTENRGVNAC